MKYRCFDCHRPLEYDSEVSPMLNNEVWDKISSDEPEEGGMLCLGCMEKRLGRKITYEDLMRFEEDNKDVPFNSKYIMKYHPDKVKNLRFIWL